MGNGQKEIAKESFRRSALSFFEHADYTHTLDLLSRVMDCPPWNEDDDHIYEVSKAHVPTYFPRKKTVQFALHRNKFDEISLDDLKDLESAQLFLPFRQNNELKELVTKRISACSQQDLADIEYSLPLLVADYSFDRSDYFNAANLEAFNLSERRLRR